VVICNILGGLGNQLFQFAAGRSMTLARGDALKLDISGFAGYGLHQGFQLQQAFRGVFNVAAESEVQAILGWQSASLVRKIMTRPVMAPLRKRGWMVEPHFQHWTGLDNAPTDCYVQGYWQSEKYFEAHAPTLRADLAFKAPLSGENSTLAARMGKVNSVSLHVRRGDYASNPTTAAMHGQCSLDYYHAAVQYVNSQVNDPVFYIFSDDMAWVREHLKIPAPSCYVDHNDRAFDDLQLMAQCKHHVIANSSFSWWGAWLNARPNKLVVAPRQWFATPRATHDLLPASWIKL
jgi:hypothetical protein